MKKKVHGYDVDADAWDEWDAWRKDISVWPISVRRTWTERAQRMAAKSMSAHPPDVQRAAVERAISAGYRGLYFNGVSNTHQQQQKELIQADVPEPRPGESWDEYRTRCRQVRH